LAAFILIAILVAAAFGYRCAAATNSRIIFGLYESLYSVGAFVVLFLCVTCAPLFLLFYIAYPSTLAARTKLINAHGKDDDGIDYNKGFFVGADFIQTTSRNSIIGVVAVGAVFFFVIVICALVIIFCIWKILRSVEFTRGSSKRKSEIHQSLKRLICQALNPLIFLYLPLLYRILPFLVNFSNPELVQWVLSFPWLIFPLLNPLIILWFTPDYRLYLRDKANEFVAMVR
ncbi:hypothetical protein PENTCL1PPCAC_3293, partial [Pristionchus entomophagus]